jgi:hypothetical protein
MSKIQAYKDNKRALEMAERWAAMIGKEYRGGGGGIGAVHSCKVQMTIYYQYSNGDTNYHESDKPFNEWLEIAVKRQSQSIVNIALELMRDRLKILACEALAENQQIMMDAGIAHANKG